MASRGFLVGDGVLRRKNDKHKITKKQINPVQKKKKKPEWDDTVSDLNVYKASQDELRRRHEAHKSKNVGWTKKIQDKENKSITPDSSTKRKQAILQEILYGKDKFQAVLAETDTTMSAVKDLFGDDPKKFLGFPNVTVAPKPEKNSERYMNGPFAEIPETPTQLSILSDSIMRTPALNELSDNADSVSSECEDNELGMYPKNIFEPQLDLQHYRQLISHESASEEGYKTEDIIDDEHIKRPKDFSNSEICNNKIDVALISASQSVIAEYSSQTSVDNSLASNMDNGEATDVSSVQNVIRDDSVPHKSKGVTTSRNQIPSNDREMDINHSKVAINPARKDEKKSQKQPKVTDTSTLSSTSSLRSLEDLKKMVESLEDEIAEYEMETGRQPSTTRPQSKNLSGYTSSLIKAVTKLMRYLKETEMQRKAEAILRDQILQGFSEQRALVDALTNDIVQVQEQNMRLQKELYLYRQNTDKQLNYLKRELEVVLKSFEYHTVQSTINTLHTTKPIPLDVPSQEQEHHFAYSHPIGPASQDVGQDHLKTMGAFIPVSAAPRQGSNQIHQFNNEEMKDAQTEVTRQQMRHDGSFPEEDLSTRLNRIPKTAHTHNNTVSHGAVQSLDHGFPYQQIVTSRPITQIRQPTNTSRLTNTASSVERTDMSKVSSDAIQHIQDPGVVASLQTRQHPSLLQPGLQNNSMSDDQRSEQTKKRQNNGSDSINMKPHANPNTAEYQQSTEKSKSFPSQENFHAQDVFPIYKSTHSSISQNVYEAGTNGSHGNSLSNADQDMQEDSLMVKSLIKDPVATRELRNRLQEIAIKQRNIAAMSDGSNRNVEKKTENVQGLNTHKPSPHVHFRLPQEEITMDKSTSIQKRMSTLPEKSPSVSPIPPQELATDVPKVKTAGLRKEKHVVVNLPSVWSDVSSTVSV